MALDRRLHGSRHAGTTAWLWQRVTAIAIGLGLLALLVALVFAGNMHYAAWRQVMASFSVRFFFFLWLLAIVVHSYLGLETILKDYVHTPVMRLAIQSGGVLLLAGLFGFGLMILVLRQ